MNRRDFLQITGISGLGLMIACNVSDSEGTPVKVSDGIGDDQVLNNYVYIDPDGTVTIVAPRPEMGQGVFQSVPMLVAEELEVDIDKIFIIPIQADSNKFGKQGVGGSATIRKSFNPYRKVGAAAKMMLVQAAATMWACSVDDCFAESGKVHNKTTKETKHYGELVIEANKLAVPKKVILKDSKDFKVIGKSTVRQDVSQKVDGSAVFGIDIEVDGMLYASIQRNPYTIGKVISYNKDEIEAQEDVHSTYIIQIEEFNLIRGGVAIVTKDYSAALRARRGLRVVWEEPSIKYSDDSIGELLEGKFKEEPTFDKVLTPQPKKLQNATQTLTADYDAPYQAHATMEPLNATVWVKPNGTVEAWVPTQNPNRTHDVIASVTGLDKDKITLNIPFLGCGLGRKSLADFTNEATQLSIATQKPIKLIWTREDDMTADFYRPRSKNRFTAHFTADKKLVGYTNEMAAQVISKQGDVEPKFPKWTFEGSNLDYEFPNYHLKGYHTKLPIPVMWWRAVYASTNGFATEGFVDEVAEYMGQDPLSFRLKYIKNERVKKVIQMIREKSEWDTPAEHEYKGFALVESFESICAEVATVVKEGAGIKIKKYTVVLDCGQTVNPDTIHAQVDGSVIMGLTATIKPGVSFKDGKPVHKNFNTYSMLRFNEVPEIELTLMQNSEKPGGVGEPALPPVAAALANALYKATGKRYRNLPIDITKITV